MDFDSVFSVFLNWQTIVLCLSIYIITYIIRTIVENISDKIKNSRYWTEIFLPLIPIVSGAIVGLIPVMFPWPLNIGDFVFAKAMYGAICGLFSGWVYNRIKAWLSSAKNLVNVTTNLPDESHTSTPTNTFSG